MSFEEPSDNADGRSADRRSADRRSRTSRRWATIGTVLFLIVLSLTTAPSCQQNEQAINGASGVTGDKAAPAATSPTSATEDSPLLAEAKLFKYPPAQDVKEPTHREAGSRSCLACHI